MAGPTQIGTQVDGFGVTGVTATVASVAGTSPFLPCVAYWASNISATPPVADSGNGWSVALAPNGVAGTFSGYFTGVAIYKKESAASGSHSCVVDIPGSFNAYSAHIEEWPYTGTSLVDKTAHNEVAAASGGSASTGTTATTSQANELIIAALAYGEVFGNTSLTSPGAPWTSANRTTNSSSGAAGETLYQEVSATGTFSAAWTVDTSVEFAAAVITIKGAAGGSIVDEDAEWIQFIQAA